MTLQDVQLNIRVNVSGTANLGALASGYQKVQSSAAAFTKTAAQPAQKSSLFNPAVLNNMRDNLREVETRFDAIFRAGIRLMQLGRSLKNAGMFGFNLLIGAAQQWGDFEFLVKKAGLALSVTGEWTNKLRDAIYGVAREIGLFDVNEVTQAYYWWGSAAGTVIDNERTLGQVTAAVTKIMLASAAAGGSVEQSIKGVYSILRQYRLSLGHAGDVTEKLYLMTLRTALEFPDLIQAFKYAGPLARSLGMELDEVIRTFGVLGDLGMRGSLPGRGFAMMLQKLLSPTADALEEINPVFEGVFGKDFEEKMFPHGMFVGMRKYIMAFAKATSPMTPHDRQALLGDFFTQNSTRIMVPIVEEQMFAYRKAQRDGLRKTPSVLKADKYLLKDAHEQSMSMQELLTHTWKATVGKLQAAWAPIQNLFGEAAANVLTPFVEKLGEVLDGVREWFSQNPEVARFLTTMLAIGSGLLVVFGQIFIITGTLLLLWGALAIAHVMITSGILAAIAPFVLAAVAIAGLAVAISTNFLGIRDILISIGDLLLRVFQPFIDLYNNVIVPMLSVEVEVEVEVKNKKGKGGVKKVIQDVFDPLRRLGEIWDDLYNRYFKASWTQIETEFIPILQHLGDIVGGAMVGSFALLARVAGYLFPPLMAVLGLLTDVSLKLLIGGWQFLMVFLEPIIGILKSVVDGFGSLANIVSRVFSGIDALFSGRWDFDRLIWDLQDIFGRIVRRSQRFLQSIQRKIEKFIGIKLEELPQRLMDILAGLADWPGIATALLDAGRWLGGKLMDAIVIALDLGAGLVRLLLDIANVEGLLESLRSAGTWLGETLGGFVRDALIAAITGLNLAQKIADAILSELNKVAIVGDFIPDPKSIPELPMAGVAHANITRPPGLQSQQDEIASSGRRIRDEITKTSDSIMAGKGVITVAMDAIVTSILGAQTAVTIASAKIGVSLDSLDQNMYSDGYHTMDTYRQGLGDALRGVTEKIKAAIENIRSQLGATSPPRNPRTRHIGKWGFATMNEYAKGLKRATDGPVRAAIRDAEREVRSMGGIGGGSISFSSASSRRITLDVNINDASGSLNVATAAQIENIFRSDLLADALEHMATVD